MDVATCAKNLMMQQGQCESGHSSPATDITGMVHIKRGSEADLLAAVATVGPVAVNVDASSKLFRVSIKSTESFISYDIAS